MKVKISIASLFIFIFVSSGTFAQYKYDVGLKASSNDFERLQLETRFHFNNPYSIVLTMTHYSKRYGTQEVTPYYNNNQFNLEYNRYNTRNTGLKIGVQRKLGFMATDVFYIGATIGVGYIKERNRYYTSFSSVPDSMPSENPFAYDWNQISVTDESEHWDILSTQFGVSFGMDVPISKRFSVNVELGYAAVFRSSPKYFNNSHNTLHPSISGGLRYSFAKRN